MTTQRPRLRAVPDAAPRALLLVRVSKERDGMTSPEIQETAARDYCQARGYVVTDVYQGIDQSGSRARSGWWATLDRAVEAVEAGQFDVVVVWKFSRVARHRVRWAVALDRIEAAGGRLESATEQFDTSTSVGQLGRGMLGELNAFYAQQIGEGWKETHARRVASGRPANGKPRWGYAYDHTTKTHVPHPEQGPVLADLYRRYVGGEAIYALVRWLNEQGWRTTVGGLWSEPTLRRVLDSGFAAGLFRAGGDERRGIAPTMHEGIHEPLIDRETWQAYLDARAERSNHAPRTEASGYLLSGLIVCARCGAAMVAHRSQPGTKLHANGKRYSAGRVRIFYRCRRGRQNGPLGCRGGYVSAAIVEDAVRGYVRSIAAQIDEATHTNDVRPARQALADVEVQRLRREVGRLDEALVRLVVQNAEHPLPGDVFDTSRRQLEDRATVLRDALARAERDARRASHDVVDLAASLDADWDLLPIRSRRALLSNVLAAVLVRPGRGERAVWVVDPGGMFVEMG